MADKFYYDQKKKVLVVCLAGCAVVSVSGSGGEIGSFFVVAGNLYYDRKKKSSHLSGGLCSCVSFWFLRLRPEKKKF